MEDHEETAPNMLGQLPPSRRRGSRWLLIGGLTFAFIVALGVGAFIGSMTSTTQAAALASGNTNNSQDSSSLGSSSKTALGNYDNSQSLTFSQGGANYTQPMAGGPGTHGSQGPCVTLTVSSVNGNTIVAKSSSGSKVTIHTTASTTYRQAGKSVTASNITVGARIHVMGTHNSDGSITATSIDIG